MASFIFTLLKPYILKAYLLHSVLELCFGCTVLHVSQEPQGQRGHYPCCTVSAPTARCFSFREIAQISSLREVKWLVKWGLMCPFVVRHKWGVCLLFSRFSTIPGCHSVGLWASINYLLCPGYKAKVDFLLRKSYSLSLGEVCILEQIKIYWRKDIYNQMLV